MKAHWIKNGKIQLILTPSDEIEVALFKQLTQTPVEISMHEVLQLGVESVNDAVVIMPQITNKQG